MKIWSIVLVFVLGISVSGEAAAQTRQQIQVSVERANVRDAPSLQGEVIFQVSQGEMLWVIQKEGGWYFAESASGRKGYISNIVVRLVESGMESVVPFSQALPSTFGNSDLIAMTKVGLSDDIIIAAIRQSDSTEFDLSPAGVITLKNGGVSEAVIQVLVNRGVPQSGSAVSSGVSALPARQVMPPEPQPVQHIPTSLDAQQTQFVRREPVAALLLSALWPGMGQFYNGPSEKKKGLIMAGAAAGSIVVMLASMSSCDYYDFSCSGVATGMTLGLLGYIGTSVYSMYDAATRAGELNRQHGFAINIQPETLGGRTAVRASVQYSFSF